jgi:hypothetical protein
MAYDERTADRIRSALSTRRDVVERKMFGGLAFMVNGAMCCGLTAEAMMVRVGPHAYEAALAQPHARPMDFTGTPLRGMVYVDPPGYRTTAQLSRWVQRGVDFVTGKPAASGSTNKPKSKAKRARARRAPPRSASS